MEEIKKKVTEIIKNLLEENESMLQESDDLVEVGLDSIAFIYMIVALEEAFNVEFPDELLLISEMNTIEKIVEIIARLNKETMQHVNEVLE